LTFASTSVLWVVLSASPGGDAFSPITYAAPTDAIDVSPLTLDLGRANESATPLLNLGSLSDDPPATAPHEGEAVPLPRFGEPGARRVFINGGFGIDDDSDTTWQAGASIDWFVSDWISIDLGLNAAYFDQTGDDALGINLMLLLRWHFWRNDKVDPTMTIYGEGGMGILLTTEDVPFDGTSFNFTPQLGVGMAFDLGDDQWLMTGVRWYHISNAATSSNNPARDSLYLYAGISLPF
jgi:hypothetical protein